MSLTDLGGATVSLLCFLPCSVPQARQSGCLTSLDCLEQRQRRLPLFPVGTIRILVKGLNDFPCIFGRFDEVEKVQVLWTDHAFIGKRLEIDHPVPELLTEKQDRNRLHLARLDQCQRFEGFRSEEHTSELQSLMRYSYAVYCLQKKKTINNHTN